MSGEVATYDALYDYGPPVVEDGGGGTPQSNTGYEKENGGGGASPHTPPTNTAKVVVPGGSPTEEAMAGYDPSITSLAPTTAVAGANVTVTVTGERFTDASVVEVDQAPVSTTYVSTTQLTAVLNGAAGTVSVTVRNPVAEQESNSVPFIFT